MQSVDRAVAILEILARDGEAGVTEVARELGVHKSTASRLLAALDRRELVAYPVARSVRGRPLAPSGRRAYPAPLTADRRVRQHCCI